MAGAPDARAEARGLSVVFLLSGFAALLYQIVWQRSLFAIYGINVEAVTVVVTAFTTPWNAKRPFWAEKSGSAWA